MIFHDDLDRKRYLSPLEEVQNRYSCKLYAYVLRSRSLSSGALSIYFAIDIHWGLVRWPASLALSTVVIKLRAGCMNWDDIPGWFQWRSAQEEAAHRFPDGSRFVEVGNFLGRSLCSLGEVVKHTRKRITLIGVDTCRGSGIEGPRGKNYHGSAVAEGGGTFAGMLHRNIIECGYGDQISLIVADSVTASTFFPDQSIDWVHLDARHDREHVKSDINAWLPKIKVDGWLSGDDYDEIKWPEVVTTVKELLPGARPWSINQWRWMLR